MMLRSERLKLEKANKQQPLPEVVKQETTPTCIDYYLAPVNLIGEPEAVKEINFDNVPATSILDKLDEEFYELLGSPKWAERKDQLTKLEGLLNVERLENDNYFELARLLEKVCFEV